MGIRRSIHQSRDQKRKKKRIFEIFLKFR